MPRSCPVPALLLVAALVVSAGCSSGNGSGPDDDVRARFLPSLTNPGPGDVHADEAATSGDMVQVAIQVTDLPGIYSADFRVFWNADRVRFLGWTEGGLLGKDEEATSFTVTELAEGQLRVEATRTGTGAPVDATGTEELMRLEFRMRRRGEAPFNFPTPDASFPRTLRNEVGLDLIGLAWTGGLLVGG